MVAVKPENISVRAKEISFCGLKDVTTQLVYNYG